MHIVHFVIYNKLLCVFELAFFLDLSFSKAPKEDLQLLQYSPFLINSDQSFVFKNKRNLQ
jgi:hypothetical protein